MVHAGELMKKPAAKKQLVAMLGELASNPALLNRYEKAEGDGLKWFQEQVQQLVALARR